MFSKIHFACMLLIAGVMTLPPKTKITVWMIGDSTMSIKDKKAYPETGWGMPFAGFFDSTVTIDNRAQNGRSTKSFLEENRWTPVLENMKQGDYVFIQFGHNDEVETKKTYTTQTQFKSNLERYVSETKSKNAIPVLLTPVARRKFDSTGKIQDTHKIYAQIVRNVAKEQHVLLIDLAESSMELLQQMGPAASTYLFNHLVAGQHPNYPEGKIDDTHFSELGARRMAELVLAEIRKQKLELSERIVIRIPK